MARIERDRARPASALTALKMLLLVEGENFAIFPAIAEIHAEAGNRKLAEFFYKQAKESLPADPAGYLQLANLHIEETEWSEAVTLLTTAYYLGDNRPELAQRIAGIHKRRDNPKSAVEWYNRVIEKKNGEVDGEIKLHLALAYRDSMQIDAARNAAKRSVEIEEEATGTAARALLLLGQIERDEGNYEQAVYFWRRAAPLPDTPPQVHTHLGGYTFDQEKYDEAAEHFQAAYDGGDHSLSVCRGLVASHLLNNDRPNAKQALSHFVEHHGAEKEIFSDLIERFVDLQDDSVNRQ